MSEQHQKIKGYRDLSDQEINLINQVKTKGEELRNLISEIEDLRKTQLTIHTQSINAPNEIDGLTRQQIEESGRCINRAEDSLKTGVMWLVRSIALPNSF